MNLIDALLLIAAALCFLGAAINVRNAMYTLIATGLFLWVLVPLLHALRALS
jgi:hypothetical protein